VWYFTPYYTILRAVPPLFNSQFPGVLAMGIATMILFFLPWLDRSPVKSIRYRGTLYKSALACSWSRSWSSATSAPSRPRCGASSGSDDPSRKYFSTPRTCHVGRPLLLGALLPLLLLMPWYTARDKCQPEPDR
jgi:ubiquinol-cytochrome c reductase cytochrome b subunit